MRAKKKNPFPIAFRFPFAASDRGSIQNGACGPGDAAAGLPEDALIVNGTWAGKGPLMLRPVFPGLLRFIATPGQTLPEIEVDAAGRITDQTFQSLAAVQGTLMVRVVGAAPLDEMRSLGTIAAIGAAPVVAFYGPVTCGESFLKHALLDHKKGLSAAHVLNEKNKKVQPGKAGWEALALAAFFAANYEPRLRCGIKLDEDDAGRLSMPTLPINGNTFQLGITFGWLRSPQHLPEDPLSRDLETIPADAFLQHVSKSMREPVHSTQGADAVIRAVLKDRNTAEFWTAELKNELQALGFGAVSGLTLIEIMLREFQLCAAGDRVATPIDPAATPAQLARRDFRDLKPIQNPNVYDGHISGLANRRTRELIKAWPSDRLRNPVLMPAFEHASLEEGVPTGDPITGAEDVWDRHQLTDTAAWVFAADLTREGLPEEQLDPALLERVGRYTLFNKKPGGPRSALPHEAKPEASAEILPMRLLKVSAEDLIDALENPAKGNTHLRDLVSCFRVVRAVSEVECVGYLDVINAYDSAGISLAPFHWAMAGTQRNPSGSCELGGFAATLAALASKYPDIDSFSQFGMATIGKSVPQPTGTVLATLGFLDDRGQCRFMSKDGPRSFMPSWRSLYRWAHVGRYADSFGVGGWHMAMRRVATVHATPIEMSPMPYDPRQTNGTRATIGSVFTSELLMAQLVRWHVKIPDGVIAGNKASEYVQNVYAAAAKSKPAPGEDAVTWEQHLEDALMGEIKAFAKKFPNHKELPKQFGQIASPDWITPGQPPTIDPAKNTNHYTLDPRLRVLTSTFRLANLK